MSNAVTKPTSKPAPSKGKQAAPAKEKSGAKRASRKAKARSAAVPDYTGDPDSPFQPLSAACETLRAFIRTLNGWEDEEDAVEALAAVGLLQRVTNRLEGSKNPALTADDGRLDKALAVLCGPTW